MQIITSFSFLTTDNNSGPCVSGQAQTPTHADSHTIILSSCIVTISYIGSDSETPLIKLKMKDDDFSPVCTLCDPGDISSKIFCYL